MVWPDVGAVKFGGIQMYSVRGSFFRRSIRRFVGAICLVASGSLTGQAFAQNASLSPGLALNRFNPAPAGDRMFGVQSPYVAGDSTPHASLLIDYAGNPLVLKTLGRVPIGAIVSDQLFLHLNVGFAFHRRVMFNLVFPIALMQAGQNPSGGGLHFTSPDSAAIGDLRLGTRVQIVGSYGDPFQLAVGGYVWAPTGNSNDGSFVGEGVRALPQIILGGRVKERFVWSFDLGPDLRRAVTFGGPAGVAQGTSVRTGAGIGVLLGESKNFQIGPEVSAGFVVVTKDDTPASRASNLEVMLGARYRFLNNFEAGAGVGTGLTSGLGTPDFRTLGMLSYSPQINKPEAARPKVAKVEVSKPEPPKPSDTDGDKIVDAEDACVDIQGVANVDPAKHGCPPDGDEDGVLDVDDACVTIKGVAHADKTKNGCPPDTDEDGVVDADDACVNIKGLATNDPATNGCPGDTDGDAIRDDNDACPNEKGKPDPDPTKHGCPVAVRVTETEIVILQQLQFETGKATIKKISDSVLDEVANALKEHPEIAKIEVQGHTDDRGTAATNKTLSQARSDSVKKALLGRGIATDRLVTKGYGQDKPIGDNKTDAGRQQNRRVQFVILEKAQKSAALPEPGPAPAKTQP